MIGDFKNLCRNYAGSTDAAEQRMIRYLRSDGRAENFSLKLQDWLKKLTRIQKITNSYSPKSNDCAELLDHFCWIWHGL